MIDNKTRLKRVTDTLKYHYSHLKHYSTFKKLRAADGIYSLRGFDRLRCIYIHIPKTAGISINTALFGNYGGGHKDVKFYKRVFGPVTYRNYFSFTFVRNPYSRLYSAFKFLKKGGFAPDEKAWAEHNLGAFGTFEQFVNGWVDEKSIHTYNHFRPQFGFVCISGREPEVDFVGRLETINEDFDYICRVLGISNELPCLNKSNADDWTMYYTDEMYRKVYRIYREDFEIFGYDPGAGAA